MIATLLAATAFACAALGAERVPASEWASIAGGEWRSILPTGTKKQSVRVAPFLLDRTPVTNAQFLAFVRQNARWQRGHAPAALADAGYLRHWQGPVDLGSIARPDQPVTRVSWFAARAYCESQGARLPYWYEWELAAAADETISDARNTPGWQQRLLQWYSKPSGRPLPGVGSEPANFYGVHDLHNLVWEWVEDFNALMVSGDSRERGDPDQLEFCGNAAMAFRNPQEYAVAMRIAMLSSLHARSTTTNLGFRCARDGARASQ